MASKKVPLVDFLLLHIAFFIAAALVFSMAKVALFGYDGFGWIRLIAFAFVVLVLVLLREYKK